MCLWLAASGPRLRGASRPGKRRPGRSPRCVPFGAPHAARRPWSIGGGGTATKTVAHIGLTRSVKECKRRRNASKDDLVSRCACLSRSSVHIRRRAVVCVTVTPGADTHRVDERCTGVDIKCSSRSEGAEPDWTVRASGRGCQRGCLGGAGAVEQRLVGREGPITAGPLVPAVGRIVMLSQHVSCEGEDATLSTSSKRCKGVLSAMHVWSLKTC
jgi:hypothetical protein